MPRPPAPATPQTNPTQAQQDSIGQTEGIDDFALPKALVTRIAKSALPPNTKFTTDTVMALTRGATVFINYLCATAQDMAHQKSHKNIAATDVIKAMEILDFRDLVDLLQRELEVHRVEAKSGSKGKNKATAEASTSNSGAAPDAENPEAYDEASLPPNAHTASSPYYSTFDSYAPHAADAMDPGLLQPAAASEAPPIEVFDDTLENGESYRAEGPEDAHPTGNGH